jgi:predicted RNA-binding Zn-ribbon protein involved in translation (DUF1610 family)
MHQVRRYQRVFEAESMATALREHGINCAVVGHHTQAAIGMEGGRLPWFGYDLVVLHKRDIETAKAMIAELESERVEPEEGWEDAARPDLSALEGTGVAVHCAACAAALPLDAQLRRCPSCAEVVDVVDRLVEEHGPEALDACYGLEPYETEVSAQAAPEPDYDPAMVRLGCPACGTVLPQETTGRCSTCGTLFDKRDMLGRMGW